MAYNSFLHIFVALNNYIEWHFHKENFHVSLEVFRHIPNICGKQEKEKLTFTTFFGKSFWQFITFSFPKTQKIPKNKEQKDSSYGDKSFSFFPQNVGVQIFPAEHAVFPKCNDQILLLCLKETSIFWRNTAYLSLYFVMIFGGIFLAAVQLLLQLSSFILHLLLKCAFSLKHLPSDLLKALLHIHSFDLFPLDFLLRTLFPNSGPKVTLSLLVACFGDIFPRFLGERKNMLLAKGP